MPHVSVVAAVGWLVCRLSLWLVRWLVRLVPSPTVAHTTAALTLDVDAIPYLLLQSADLSPHVSPSPLCLRSLCVDVFKVRQVRTHVGQGGPASGQVPHAQPGPLRSLARHDDGGLPLRARAQFHVS